MPSVSAAGNVTAMNEKLFDCPLTELQQEVLSVVGEYRDLYLPHRSLANEDQLRVVSRPRSVSV